jgi:hypothetical protein
MLRPKEMKVAGQNKSNLKVPMITSTYFNVIYKRKKDYTSHIGQ